MKKTTSLNLSKRVAQYGALSMAIAGIADANGQIIYTDVDPDSAGTAIGNDVLFDLDNNLTNDFVIRQSSSNLGIAGLSSAAILGNPNGGSLDNYKYPYALSNGAVISSGANYWIQSNYFQTMNYDNCYFGNGGDYNNWCNVTDKYLGLRFLIGAETHYGWARLDVISMPGNWILKDYAYNTVPESAGAGHAIMAGEGMPLGINDNLFSKVKIVALNKSIALFNLPQQTNYRLFSITGQSVLNGDITNSTHTIEASTLASGIYIIELQDSKTKAVTRKKIVL